MKESEAQEEPIPDKLIQSTNSLDEIIVGNIAYSERLSASNLSPEMKANMTALMNMGFCNFDLNVNLLDKNMNNIDVVLSKMFD